MIRDKINLLYKLRQPPKPRFLSHHIYTNEVRSQRVYGWVFKITEEKAHFAPQYPYTFTCSGFNFISKHHRRTSLYTQWHHKMRFSTGKVWKYEIFDYIPLQMLELLPHLKLFVYVYVLYAK